MRDRGGAEYLTLFERQFGGKTDFSANPADWEIGQVRAVARLSPTRRRETALGLSGRQLVKWRKAQRRTVK